MSRTLAERVGAVLERRTSRRGLLARTTMAGTALAVAPSVYVLRPVSAYAAVCGCGGQPCSCGAACCDNFTEFCCTLTGINACPPGSFAGGWWKAEGTPFCDGPRYYVDCHSRCTCAGACAGGSPFCGPACDGLTCGCAKGDCNLRQAGCASFRYGQCNQQIGCAGRIVCRAVSCTPPWLVDPTCTTVPAVDQRTALHTAPCLDAVVAGLVAAPDGQGYWIAQTDGGVFAYGSAAFRGSPRLGRGKAVVAMVADPSTGGYWVGAADGGVFAYDARFRGSLGDRRLTRPIVGMAAVPDGSGYWMVAADGGLFAFGSAGYFGSLGERHSVRVVGMAPAPDGAGYWLLGADGGVFAFGSAPFLGSTAGSDAGPVAAIAALPSGSGYWVLGRDGVVHPFGEAASYGDRSTSKVARTGRER